MSCEPETGKKPETGEQPELETGKQPETGEEPEAGAGEQAETDKPEDGAHSAESSKLEPGPLMRVCYEDAKCKLHYGLGQCGGD